MLRIDHVGIVAPRGQLDAVVNFYCRHFACTVAWREAETDVDAIAIGLPGENVRLKGAVLFAGAPDDAAPYLEIHQYLVPTGETKRRVCDAGIGHFAWWSDDIEADYTRLGEGGMSWNAAPRLIETGGLTGHWWVYGQDPWGNVVQLCHHPDRPDSVTHRHDLADATTSTT